MRSSLIMQHQLFGTWLLSEARQGVWFLSQMHVFTSRGKIITCANWHGSWPSVCRGRASRPWAHGLGEDGPGLGSLPLLLTGLKAEKSGWHWIYFNSHWHWLEIRFIKWEVKPDSRLGRSKLSPAGRVCCRLLKLRPFCLQKMLLVLKKWVCAKETFWIWSTGRE